MESWLHPWVKCHISGTECEEDYNFSNCPPLLRDPAPVLSATLACAGLSQSEREDGDHSKGRRMRFASDGAGLDCSQRTESSAEINKLHRCRGRTGSSNTGGEKHTVWKSAHCPTR